MISNDKLINHIKNNKLKIQQSYECINDKFIEIDENLLLEKSSKYQENNLITIKIGFPFTVNEFVIDSNDELEFCHGYNFIFRGPQIREQQHKSYINSQIKSGLVYNLANNSDIDKYRQTIKEVIGVADRILYVDPHNQENGTNIGDSFISLYYPKIFAKNFNAKHTDVYTRSKKHLVNSSNMVFYDYSELETVDIDKYDLVVISDFVDVNSEHTCKILSSISSRKNYKVIINGRNSCFVKSGNVLTHFKYNQADPILTNKGIEDYMLDCSDPFIINDQEIISQKEKFEKCSFNSIFINPFTSKAERDLSPDFVHELISVASKLNDSIKFYISSGLNGDKEKLWIKAFLDHGESTVASVLNPFNNLVEVIGFINSNNSICISADTSITHLCIEHKKPCITVYVMKYFNLDSPQSIAEIFTRKTPYLLPLSLYDDNKNEVIESIKYLLDVLFGHISLTYDNECYNNALSDTLRGIRYVELSRNGEEFAEAKCALEKSIQKALETLPLEVNNLYEQFNHCAIAKNVCNDISAKYLISYIVKCSILTKIGAVA